MRDSRSTPGYRITTTVFRPGSSRRSRRQAPFCRYTLCAPLPTALRAPFARLRYAFGGDRPSQTAHLPRSWMGCAHRSEHAARRRVVFHRWLPLSWRPGLNASHLCYTASCSEQWQAAVKVHGVFLSCRGYSESSPRLQFRRARGRDSAQVVTPFVQVGTYPTRNFATLGPL